LLRNRLSPFRIDHEREYQEISANPKKGLRSKHRQGFLKATIDLPVSPLIELALSAQDALEIGLSNGGWEFIRQQTDSIFWASELTLHHEDTYNDSGPILWRIDFHGGIVGPGQRVFADASTGEIIEVSKVH
jgi:hypothetical protein